VVQIFEDAECFLPGIPRFLRFAGGEVVVAEVGEDLGEVAEAVFCVAEAVPGGGLVLTVAEFVVQG
jgi:hypothetical protein